MCYHKQDVAMEQELWAHYQAMMKSESYLATYYENGFDFKPSPVLTVEKPKEFTFMKWGLVPWWTKSSPDARQIRLRTLNCISEEMYDKSSFRDSAKEGKRCLIPCTGFFEWRWFNNGKNKYPYVIHIKSEKIFSMASGASGASTGTAL